MKKDTIFNIVLTTMGLALSLFLAIGGWSIRENLGIRTPGMLVSDALVPPKPSPNQLEAVGEGLRMQMFVDWIFWFAVMLAIYLMVTALGRRLKVPRAGGPGF
jgi:hypothetical protein